MNLINKNLIQDRSAGSKVSKSMVTKAKKEKAKLMPTIDPFKPKEPIAPIMPAVSKIEVNPEQVSLPAS